MPEDQNPNYPGFPGNSDKSKKAANEPPKEKKVEKVVTSIVVQRKKPLGKRIAESFSGDDARSVGQYLLFDVVMPAAKNMISDLVSQGIDRLLFGESQGRSRSNVSINRGGSGYSKMYSGSGSGTFRPDADRPGSRQLSYKARATHNFDDVVMATRAEAEGVLYQLQELVNEYDQATVSDLYALCDITGNYTDDKWGWTDLRGSKVERVREGWLLVLPRTEPLP